MRTDKYGHTLMWIPSLSRRSFFARAGAGFAGLAPIDLLSRDGFFAHPSSPLPRVQRRRANGYFFSSLIH